MVETPLTLRYLRLHAYAQTHFGSCNPRKSAPKQKSIIRTSMANEQQTPLTEVRNRQTNGRRTATKGSGEITEETPNVATVRESGICSPLLKRGVMYPFNLHSGALCSHIWFSVILLYHPPTNSLPVKGVFSWS